MEQQLMKNGSASWRERRNMLGATLFVTVLYLMLHRFELHAMGELLRRGWFVGTAPESAVAESGDTSALRTNPELPGEPAKLLMAWRLGRTLGWASTVLGSYAGTPEIQLQRRRSMADPFAEASRLAAALGAGTVEVLPVRTPQDFVTMRTRIEADELGIASRIEAQAGSGARHLFLLAMQVGMAYADLSSGVDLIAPPPGAEIARHAIAASVPEQLWRPLTKATGSIPAEAAKSYLEATRNLEQWLVRQNDDGTRK